MATESDIPYGAVLITEGDHVGRIGYYDDSDTLFPDDTDWTEDATKIEPTGREVAIVYFGAWLLSAGYYLIPFEHIRPVTIDDLMRRREELTDRCSVFWNQKNPESELEEQERLDLMYELHFVESELVKRLVEARYAKSGKGQRVFISHSSKDKVFARWLWSDLKQAGYEPWFDEDEIVVGQSIPQRIADGLQAARFLVVVLSEQAVASHWVEREWHAKYWSEVESGATAVLPALYQSCAIPEFLKTKKYADFRSSYSNGLEDLLFALHRLTGDSADDS